MRSDLWGSREGILFIRFQISNITALSCGGDDFEKAPCVDADIFIRIKNMRFQKYAMLSHSYNHMLSHS